MRTLYLRNVPDEVVERLETLAKRERMSTSAFAVRELERRGRAVLSDSLLGRIWDLRNNLGAYNAGYVALAEALGCPLDTAGAQLSGAPGIRCAVTVVPR